MFVVSKLIGFLLNPLVWIGLCIASAILVKKRRNLWLRVAVLLFVFFTNPFLSNLFMAIQESDPVTLGKGNTYRTGVLLTGMTSGLIDKPGIHFESGADRFTETVALYHAGVIDHIIISGGSGLISDPKYSESPLLAELAVTYGVPDSVIYVESNSRNTYENALFSKQVLSDLGTDSCLIITSSFHMKRARHCFEKQGLTVATYPTDFRAEKFSLTIYNVVPSIGALATWDTLLHEWFGMVYYMLRGYT